MKKRNIREIGVQLALLAFGLIVIAGVALTFMPNLLPEKDPIPTNVTGDLRIAYAFALTDEGNDLLEHMPCFCMCKNIGHLHTRDCFWTDEGRWDKHGMRCKICVEIAVNTKLMHEDGKDVCEIREKIDSYYERIAEHVTETPMPEGCES